MSVLGGDGAQKPLVSLDEQPVLDLGVGPLDVFVRAQRLAGESQFGLGHTPSEPLLLITPQNIASPSAPGHRGARATDAGHAHTTASTPSSITAWLCVALVPIPSSDG